MKAITREEKIMSGENLTPITRKEMFLAKASGMDIETPIPITREEMFLSKITGGGGSTNLPLAYTVSSVDELPSDAVDGSMAIVGNDDIVGSWKLNNELDFSTLPEYDNEFSLDFTSNGKHFTSFDLYPNTPGEVDGRLRYWSGNNISAEVYQGGLDYICNPAYMTFTVNDYPENDEVEYWIRANARKLYTIYTHENGQWVYKCEVV